MGAVFVRAVVVGAVVMGAVIIERSCLGRNCHRAQLSWAQLSGDHQKATNPSSGQSSIETVTLCTVFLPLKLIADIIHNPLCSKF